MPPELVALWLETLYTQLRQAEGRAADTALPPPARRAAIATAQYIVRQIMTQQAALARP